MYALACCLLGAMLHPNMETLFNVPFVVCHLKGCVVRQDTVSRKTRVVANPYGFGTTLNRVYGLLLRGLKSSGTSVQLSIVLLSVVLYNLLKNLLLSGL